MLGSQPVGSQLYGGTRLQQQDHWSGQQRPSTPQPTRPPPRGQGDGPARQLTASLPGVYSSSGGDAGGGHQWTGLPQQGRQPSLVAEEPATQGGESQPVFNGENDDEYRRHLCSKMFSPLR